MDEVLNHYQKNIQIVLYDENGLFLKDNEGRYIHDDFLPIGGNKPINYIPNGGLISLFGIIGYYLQELEIGPLAKVAEILKPLMVPDKLGYRHLYTSNYFQIIANSQQEILDNAFYLFQFFFWF